MRCYEVPKYAVTVCVDREEDVTKVKIGNELLSDSIARKEAYETEVPPI